MTSCKVCWKCYGLFTDQKVFGYKMKTHLKSCTGYSLFKGFNYFEYFVCNKYDYRILTNLKKCLRICGTAMFSNANLQEVLPSEVINCLIALSENSPPGHQQTQEFQELNKRLKVKKATCDKLQSNTFNKSCQTIVYKAAQARDTDFHDSHQEVNVDPVSDTFSVNNNQQIESTNTLLQNPPDLICDMSRSVEICKSDKSSDMITTNLSEVNQFSCVMENHEPILLDRQDEAEIRYQTKVLLASEEEKLQSQCHFLTVETDSFFICKLCSHKSKSDKLMLRHLSSHNEGHPFECGPCSFSTIWRREWNQHLHSHKKQKMSCSICHCEFWKKDKLDEHVASAHPEMQGKLQTNKLCCSECNYVAKSSTVLKEHMRKHTGEVFTCPHEGCEFKSVYERSLQKHLRQKHAEEKSQICWVCGFQTRHTSSLSKHMLLRHQEFKPYKCAQCPFKALYPSEVISHAKSKHLKQKRFSCSICQFQTSYPLAIQKHVERHKGVRGFFCFLCGEVLDSAVKVKKHLEQEHGCTDDRILNESSTGKVRPSDYKLLANDRSNVENAYHVLVVKPDMEELVEKSIDNATVRTNMTVEIGSSCNILDAPLDGEAISAENILSKDLDNAAILYNSSAHKRGNPMLSATTKDLGDMDNSPIEDSLFDLMSDFPRPPGLNRSQSASTLMFTSFSPHLIDRPMTPDFFTDSPSVGSFFSSFSTKNLDAESLSMGNLPNFEGSSHTLSVPPSGIGLSASSSLRGVNPVSPVLPSFITSPEVGSSGTLDSGSMPSVLLKQGMCMGVDSLIPNSILSGLSQLVSCGNEDQDCPDSKSTAVSFISANSAFTTLNTEFSSEIQAAVASIPSPEESHCCTQPDNSMTDESPFPVNVL